MSLVTKYKPGTFCWVDLATNDAAGAGKFYTALFGWTTEAMPIGPDEEYVMCLLNGHSAAAYHQPSPEHSGGLPPHWKSYIMVDDVDATTKLAAELGGQVVLPAMDVFTSGRMALVMDPTGAMFGLWQPRDHIGASIVNEPGALIWNEIITPDTRAAGDFYRGLFNWTIEAHDTGDMVYHMFLNGERPTAGMFSLPAAMDKMPPMWTVYFAVADADASASRASELGGKIIRPPTDIPDVGRFAVVADPQGAAFNIMKLLREPTPYEA